MSNNSKKRSEPALHPTQPPAQPVATPSKARIGRSAHERAQRSRPVASETLDGVRYRQRTRSTRAETVPPSSASATSVGPSPAVAQDKVGYCNPPKHTQFPKGKSGNPKGRPKARKNNATVAGEVLNEKVPVRINGVMRKISIREVALQQQGKRAAAGDAKAFKFLIDLEGPSAAAEITAAAANAMEPNELDPTALAILIDDQRQTLRAEGMTDTQIDAVLRSLGLLPPEAGQ